MISTPTQHTEILVVGAGPAGLAAATAAVHAGARVTVLDDNPHPGGQIWRDGISALNAAEDLIRTRTVGEFRASSSLQFLPGRRVIDAPGPRILKAFVEESGSIETFEWDRLILATGARERFLPFPGWTLPGFFGAGGLQALVKGGYSVAGKQIVLAGTGPLLLAVAFHLQQYGAKVVTIAEQASVGKMLGFAARLCSHPAKLIQGARYRGALAKVPYRTGCWPVSAEGKDRVTAVRLTDGKRIWTEPCDLLACGFHLVPNTELATLLGCKFTGDFVSADAAQKTSLEDVYCAGEPTGIAGLDAALIQGQIAGLTAVNKRDQAALLYKQRDREQAFARKLETAFALRPELRSLAQPDTIVCRCEDVHYSQLRSQTSWTEAKLQTRCGMGPCQGRICGPAVQTLFGWRNTSVRPPLFPVPLSALISAETATSSEIPQPKNRQLQETL